MQSHAPEVVVVVVFGVQAVKISVTAAMIPNSFANLAFINLFLHKK
jgi:hypothetical protein